MGIKGHTKIELTDVHTGDVEIIESDNFITKGIEDYLKNYGLPNPTALGTSSTGSGYNNSILAGMNTNNYVKMFFGGMMLFDKTLTENVNNYFGNTLEGATMIGNGVNNATSNDSVTEFGSVNSEETGWQEDGSYKQVWDFTTTQANGTIASVCLCPYNYGWIGAGNSTSGVQKTTGQTGDINNLARDDVWRGQINDIRVVNSGEFATNTKGFTISVNFDENYIIVLCATSNPVTLKARKVEVQFSKMNMRYGIENPKVLETQTITLPTLPTATKYVNNMSWLGVDNSGNFYLAVFSSSSETTPSFTTSNPIVILRLYEDGNGVVQCTTALTITPATLGLSGTHYVGSNNILNVCGEYLIISASSTSGQRGTTYRIKLSTQSVETMTSISTEGYSAYNYRVVLPQKNEIILSHQKVDIANNRIIPVNYTASVTQPSIIGLIKGLGLVNAVYSTNLATGNLNFRVTRYSFFLSTINNLQSPVVKTADKTMKVTYVLRFDAE